MLPIVHEGRVTVTERDLRSVTRSLEWGVQRGIWSGQLDPSRCLI